MVKDKIGFIIKPHKNLEKIFKEHRVNPTKEQLYEFADKFAGAVIEKAVDVTHEFGKEIGVKDEELMDFVRDVVRTMLFYLGAIHMIDRILGE